MRSTRRLDPDTRRGQAWRALILALLAAAVYWVTPALAGQLTKHPAVYFDQLADAFLHGRLYLIDPTLTYDLTFFNGHWFVPFPPGPALLILPLVALFGPQAAFEVPFSAALAGLSAGLLYLALKAMRARGWIEAGERACLWLTALFAVGTVLWVTASTGSVWFLAHVVTVAFLALALALAARRAQPGWVGLALAGALLARPDVALAAPFLMIELWLRERKLPLTRYVLRVVYLLLPPFLAVTGLLWYNAARFGNPFEFGYRAANVPAALAADLAAHGVFSLSYLGRNATVAFLGLPDFRATFPFFVPNVAGMSLFLTTPAVLYLFRRRPRQPWEWAAWGEILLLNGIVLLYYNTGWQQFGYRFSLDYMLFAICLVAAGAGRRVSPLLAFLIVLSVLMNLRGVVWWFGGP